MDILAEHVIIDGIWYVKPAEGVTCVNRDALKALEAREQQARGKLLDALTVAQATREALNRIRQLVGAWDTEVEGSNSTALTEQKVKALVNIAHEATLRAERVEIALSTLKAGDALVMSLKEVRARIVTDALPLFTDAGKLSVPTTDAPRLKAVLDAQVQLIDATLAAVSAKA